MGGRGGSGSFGFSSINATRSKIANLKKNSFLCSLHRAICSTRSKEQLNIQDTEMPTIKGILFYTTTRRVFSLSRP